MRKQMSKEINRDEIRVKEIGRWLKVEITFSHLPIFVEVRNIKC